MANPQMRPLDPNDYAPAEDSQQGQPPAAIAPAPQQQQQAAPASPAPGIPAGLKPILPAAQGDYEALPDYANGLSPLSPVNQTPPSLSIEDRTKLAFGNDAGREAYLKQKFPAVNKDEQGNFVVQDKDGAWYRTDTKGFGNADAWTVTKGILRAGASFTAQSAMGIPAVAANKIAEGNPVSKEIMSDFGDMAPTGLAATTSAVAGMASGGTSVLLQAGAAGGAGGAGSLINTSLGRLVGTYQATPEEQIKDAAFETMLNAGGVMVAAGVRPTAAFIGKHISKLADAFRKTAVGAPIMDGLEGAGRAALSAAGKPLEMIKKTYAAVTVGEENFDTFLEHDGELAARMTSVGRAASNDVAYEGVLINRSIVEAKKAAMEAPKLLSDTYRGMTEQLAKNIGPDFRSNVQEVTSGIFKKAVDDGFVTLMEGSRKLTQAQASEVIANAGGLIPKGFRPVTLGMPEVKAAVQTSGQLAGAGEVAFDEQAYSAMKGFFNKAAELHKVESLPGQAGFKQLMMFNKMLDDQTYKLKLLADNEGLAAVARQMSDYHQNIIRETVGKQLDKQGVGEAFNQMQKTWSSLKTQLQPLLSAKEAAMKNGSDQAYERVLSQLSTRPGKNQSMKNALDVGAGLSAGSAGEGINGAIEAAKQYASKSVDIFKDVQKQVRINNAAIAFNPWVKKNVVGQGSLTMAGGAMLTGNPTIAGVLAGGAAVTSPRIAMANLQVAKGMMEGTKWLAQQGAEKSRLLFSDPAAVDAFISATMRSPMVREQVRNQLLAPATGGQ